MDTSEVYEDFLNLESSNSNGKYFDIEEKLMSAYSSTTQSLFASRFNEAVYMLIEAPIEDQQDINQRKYNSMLMYQIVTKNDFDSLDIVLLEEIAEQCPLEGGMAVMQARTMLWPFTGLKYINDCELEGWEYGERRTNFSLIQSNSMAAPNALVYPNPANEELYIELLNCENAELELYDISGRLCLQQQLSTMSKLDISNLTNGLYIYKVSGKVGLIKAGRIVITK